jgi:hypothetical protein
MRQIVLGVIPVRLLISRWLHPVSCMTSRKAAMVC